MRILFKYALFALLILAYTRAEDEAAAPAEKPASPASEEPAPQEQESGDTRKVIVSDTPPDLDEGQVAITKRVVKNVENEDGTMSQIVSYETVQINQVDEEGNVIG